MGEKDVEGKYVTFNQFIGIAKSKMLGFVCLKLLVLLTVCGLVRGRVYVGYTGEEILLLPPSLDKCDHSLDWKFDGGDKAGAQIPKENATISERGLRLRNLRLENSGLYSCSSEGDKITLDVLQLVSPPRITNKNHRDIADSHLSVSVGHVVDIYCEYSYYKLHTGHNDVLHPKWHVVPGMGSLGTTASFSNTTGLKRGLVLITHQSHLRFNVTMQHFGSKLQCTAEDDNKIVSKSGVFVTIVQYQTFTTKFMVMVAIATLFSIVVGLFLCKWIANLKKEFIFERDVNPVNCQSTTIGMPRVDPESLRITKEEAVRYKKMLIPPIVFE